MRKFGVSFRYAAKGIAVAWSGRNFRIQTAVGFLTVVAALLLRFTYTEFIAVIVCVALVLTAEMLNTVMEEVLDVIAPQYSEHVGRVKDLAAGVVLLLSAFAVIVGALTVVNHFAGWIPQA